MNIDMRMIDSIFDCLLTFRKNIQGQDSTAAGNSSCNRARTGRGCMVITNACFWHNLCLSFAPRDRLPGTISPTDPSSSFLDVEISLDVCANTCKSLSLPARLPRQVSSLGMYFVALTLRVFVARESQERLAEVRPKYWSCRLKLRIPRSCCAADDPTAH